MTVYELINPSDAWTFLAPSDKIAFLVALSVGRGQTSAKREGWEGGMYVFGVGDPEKDFKKEFGEELEGAIGRHKAELAKSLRTFMIHREKIKKAPTGKALAKWNDEHRSSVNDFGSYALRLADHLEKGAKKKGTG